MFCAGWRFQAEQHKPLALNAARDAVISVEGAVTRLLEKVLAADVDAALSDPATAAAIAAEAVKDIVASGEISAPAKIADSVRSRLAAKTNLMVAIDETFGTGFTVKLDGGRVEHDFTGATVTVARAPYRSFARSVQS